jgi:hypothetical protein
MPEVAFETVDYAVENPFEIRKKTFPMKSLFMARIKTTHYV